MAGDEPSTRARFFDTTGYHYLPVSGSSIPSIYGGPRARLFWPEVDLVPLPEQIASYVTRGFDEPGYLALHADVAAAVQAGELRSGLEHFNRYGRFGRRRISLRAVSDWPERLYLAVHPDVIKGLERGVFATGLEHYVRFRAVRRASFLEGWTSVLEPGAAGALGQDHAPRDRPPRTLRCDLAPA